MLKLINFFIVTTSIFFMSACGQKGPLYIQHDNEMPQVEYVHEQDMTKSTNNNTESTEQNLKQ